MLQNTTNHLLNTGYNLQPGIGYVSDTGRLASSVCFNVNRTIESGVDGRITFDMDKSFNEIEKSLGFSIDVGIGYGAFSSSTKASYLREIKVIVYRLIIFKNLKILNIFNSIIPAL